MKRLVGYTDPLSVEPGEILRCFVSCPEELDSFEATVVRMLAGSPAQAGPGLRYAVVDTAISGRYRAQSQPIHPGSYGVAPSPPAGAARDAVSLQVNFKPTLETRKEQVLMAWGDPFRERGVALYLDADLRLGLAAGSSRGPMRFVNQTLSEVGRWHAGRAVVTADGHVRVETQSSSASGEWRGEHGQSVGAQSMVPDASVVVLGGCPVGLRPSRPEGIDRHFNGYLERPLIAGALLSESDSSRLANPSEGLTDIPPTVIAVWDFSDRISSWFATDRGPYVLEATFHNLPRRAVCGSNWEADTRSWREAPQQYGAVHFLRDAVEDCSWSPAFELQIQPAMRSGFYAVRVRAGADEDLIPFFVHPKTGHSTSSLLFLAPTATYLSYSNSRFWWERALEEAVADRLIELGPEDQYVLAHPEVGASIYDRHDDGTDVCFASERRPNLFMRAAHLRHEGYVSDLYTIDWLERHGLSYDVITDHDLHRDGLESLRRYAVVITGTHPEYISSQEWDALNGYRNAGGRIMYLGGNGFQGRVNFDSERPWIMENRRVDFWLSGAPTRSGEMFLATDGEPGGNLAKVGRGAMELVGVANTTMGFNESRPYMRSMGEQDLRSSFVFGGVDEDVIGNYGLIDDGVVGQEWDNAAGHERPSGHILLARSSGHSIVPALFGASNKDYQADLVLLLARGGGAVFSASSMAWSAALPINSFDNDVARITGNVLRRFLDPAPFPDSVAEEPN